MNPNILRDIIRRAVIVAVFTIAIAVGLFMELKPTKVETPPVNTDIPIKPLVLGVAEINLVPNLNPETVVSSDIKSNADFVKLVKTFPDGAFKSNLLFVLAADCNGDSIKLNEILQAYGMLLKAQLKRANTN